MSSMEDGRKKKVEAGREKFAAYQKKKQSSDKGISFRNELENEIESDYSYDSTNASSFTNQEHEENLGDSPSIHSPSYKSSAIKHLYKQIKALQNELTDKDVLIDSLQVELETIRNLSHFEASTGPIPNLESFEQKIAELQQSLRTRDAYIEKLSEDLQQKAQVCDAAVQQEKQRLEEIHNLHQKLKDAFEVIENKFGVSFTDQQEQIYNLQSKVSQMNSNVQDNTALVNDLRQALERKDNDLKRKEKELQEKIAQLKKHKETTAKEIHGLMGDVEKLHQMIVSKENELIKTKEDMANLHLQLETQYKEQIKQMKQEFWKKQEEEKERFNQIHDDVLQKCLKNHEIELARQNMNMTTEFTTYKLSCEAQFSSYRECMESLIQKIDEDSKRLEEDYEKQIANCNKELDICRQQIDNYEKRLSEEVQKVEQNCRCAYESELFMYKCSFENKSSSAEEEIEKLTKNLRDLVSSEAKKEVELETYKYELKKSKDEVNELLHKLDIKQEDIRKHEDNLKVNKEEVVQLSDKLKQAELKEIDLLKELQKYQTVVKEYEEKITAFNVSLKEDLEHVEMKHLNVLKGYEKEIEKLKCALDDKTKGHENELLYYTKELLNQKDLTSTADVSNNSEQLNKEEINSLEAAIDYSNKLVKKYDKKLNEMRKSHIDDLTLYENEITNLKENLNKVSNIKQKLLQQLVNHKKDFKDLKNKLRSLIYNCQTSNNENDIHSSSFEMVDDDEHLEKLKCELDLSKSELYEFIDCLKTSLKNIELDQSVHLQNLSCENNELREQLSILQSAHSLLTENKSIYENKPCYVVASCQTDSSKEVLDESVEDVYVQNLDLSKKNSELIKLNNQLTTAKDVLQKEANKLLSDKNCLEEERKKCFCTQYSTEEVIKVVETETKEQDDNNEKTCLKQIFKGIATSTPIYLTQSLVNNNDITSTPKRHKFNLEKLEGQLTAVHWLEECSRLENENYSLETQIGGMQTNIKEMEHCLTVARNEITLFEMKCKKLGERLGEMEKYKRLANSWEQQSIQYKMRNEHLEKDRDILKIDLKVLTEQNLYLERKNNESILKFCKQISNNQTNIDFEDIIIELKEKSDEIILLKDKIFVDQQNQLSLKDRIEEMVYSLNNAIYNFDETKKELENARMELEEAYKDREEIVLEKRLLEKELFVLTSKVKYMDLGKEKHSIKTSMEMCKFIKEFQQDLEELKKQNVQERALMERITLEKSVAESREISPLTKEELNLLMESNILLTKEKEKLMQCVQEQQHLLSTIRNENGLTEDYWMSMCDVQTKLITELRDHLDQHRKIVEVLKSVEKFNDGLSLLRDQLSEKIHEKSNLEEQLQEENASMKVMVKQVAELEDQLKKKNDFIQTLKHEKDSLNSQLITIEENLFISENKNTILERTLRDREIRLKHGQLELRASQLDRSGHNLSLEPVIQTSSRLVDVQSELEQHNKSLQAQLQRLYNIQSHQTSLQYNQKFATMEQQYQDQVSTLQKMLDEKSSDVNNLLNNRLLSSLDLPTDVADSRFQDLLDFKENHRAELEDLKRSLDDKGLRLYFILRDKFQLYAQHQVMFAIAKFKNEHELLSESKTKTLISKHQQELQLLKANMEVEKEMEISSYIQDLDKQYCEEIAALNQLLDIQNRKLNMTHCTESEVALNQLLICLSNEYTQSVQTLQNSWKENYKQCLEKICDNLNKNLGVKTSSISMDLNTNLTDNEKLDKVEELLRQEEMVVSKAQELQTRIQEKNTTALQEFKQALEEAHQKVVNTIPVLKKQLEEGNVISEQEKEIVKLKSAKENLETEHKSAINLLLKDHESELSSVRTLLSQLQQRTVNNGGGDMTISTLRAELEMKHAQEMEKLRTYFERKCADLEKHYSEEIYSQQSRKVSGNSSCSESEAGIDIYYMGGGGDLNHHTPQHEEHNGELHEECEKQLAKVKKELEEMRLDLEAKYESDLEAVKSDYAVRFEEYIRNHMSLNQNAELQAFEMKLGVVCGQTERELESDMENVITDWERRLEIEKIKFEQEKENGIAELRRELEEKYSRKLDELHRKFLSMSQDQDLELKVAQIKSEVKEDYESEIHKIRDEIETIERLRKEEEIENLKDELNRQHMKELEKVKIAYEEMVKKEVENSLLKTRNETNISHEYEENIEFIKEQVKADYEKELEKIRRNVESIETQRKNEEIQHLKDALKQIHAKEIENIKSNCESQMKNEMESLKKQFKFEIENIETKHKDEIKIMQEMLENSAQDQLMQNNDFETVEKMFENKMQEQVGQIFNLNNEIREIEEKHKSKVIEMNEDWECKLNEIDIIHKNEVKLLQDGYEQKFLEQRRKYVELESLHFQALSKIEEQEVQKLDRHAWTLQEQEEEVQRRIEEARTEILHSLEQQIKALVASSDEGEDKSEWPPELATLEQQFTSKYQCQLAQLIEKHALEIADIHADYEERFSSLIKEYSLKQAENMPQLAIATGDEELDKIIIERDNLRKIAIALRQIVGQLANYLINCEEELNNTLVGELLRLEFDESKMLHNTSKITVLSGNSSEEENEPSLDKSMIRSQPKRVHFAPDVTNIITLLEEDSLLEYFDKNRDISMDFGNKLGSCLERLKLESAALLGLTTLKNKNVPEFEGRRLSSITRQLIEEKKSKDELNNKLQESQEILAKYEQELSDLRTELNEIIDRHAKEKAVAASTETVYAASPVQARIQKITQLQDKARGLIAEKGECPPQWLQLIDELCREGDSLADEARRDREDLQQQVEAADKQLRSTRAFLEDQAAERELERDEFNKEVRRLQELLREKERDWTTKERFAIEAAASLDDKACTNHAHVETLEQQIRETTELLKITQDKKDELETELKAAVDKIWVLRDIISEQEVQVSNKSEREATLEQRLDELETELDKQNRAQQKMLQELEELREFGGDAALLEQINVLQDQLKKQTNSSLVRQMKSQLREMSKSVDKRIKELEALNINASAASLSSPSEDISIREQLESWNRCDTPEDRSLYAGSPPAPLPSEEVNKLQEKLVKLSRVEETVMKKLKDQQIQLSTVRSHIEDIQVERDVLQQQCDKQLEKVASLTSRLDEMRIRTDREQTAANLQLQDKIRNLENQKKILSDKITGLKQEVTNLKERLNCAQEMVSSQDEKLRSILTPKEELIDKLQQEIAVMHEEKQKLQNVVEKYRSAQNVSLPSLIEMLLAEKNADIDRLQERVAQFQSYSAAEHSGSGHLNSKGHRVSFASDLTNMHLQEEEKLRSAAPDISLQPNMTSLSMGDMVGNELVLQDLQKNFSSIAEPQMESKLYPVPTDRIAELEAELLKVCCELAEKTERLTECEAQLPLMEEELQKTKEELLSTVTAVTEDKKYYQEHLEKLTSTQTKLNEKENEVEKLKDTLARKEEDIVKTTADVRALQMILENLQKKLQEAKQYVENKSTELAKKEIEQLKKEKLAITEQHEQLKSSLEKIGVDNNKLKKNLESEKKSKSKLKEILMKAESEKDFISNELKKTENEKNLISKELQLIKSNCEIHQSELESSLIRIKEQELMISDLKKQVEYVTANSNKYLSECSNLKSELKNLSQHHSNELLNLSKKSANEVAKLKEEVEELQRINTNLKENCNLLDNKLKQKIFVEALLNNNEDKIKQLEFDIKQLQDSNSCLKEEKRLIEEKFGLEISELKMLMNDLNGNAISLKKSEQEYQLALNKEKELQNIITRKYETLKVEYDRQRRARKEMEKKCHVQRQELEKEKRYVALLEEQISGKGKKCASNLRITETDVFEIKPDAQYTDVDDLATKLQRELNLSLQLDKNISTYQDDYPVRPMGPEASTPAPRPVSPEGLFNLDISPIVRPVRRRNRHEISHGGRPLVQRQLFGDPHDEQIESQPSQRSNRLPIQPIYGAPGSNIARPVDPSVVVLPPGMERPCPIRLLPPVCPQVERRRQPKNNGTESKLFKECVLPLPNAMLERVFIENRLRAFPKPAARQPLNNSGTSGSPEFGGIMGLPGSPIEQDAPHRQLLKELFQPPRWHFQPPRGVRYGLPTGTRPGYPEDTPVFVPPPSPPPPSPMPIFVRLRNVSSRSSFPNVQRRPKQRVIRSLTGSLEQPLRPLLFDQLPSHRHTYGGIDRHGTAPQAMNASIPENLHQYQFQPLIVDRQPEYYTSQPIYHAPSTSAFRPASLPIHLSQTERRIDPEIMFPRRLIGDRSSFPMGPPVMSSTLIAPPNLPADVTLYSVPEHFDHIRPYEPLSQTVLRRIPASPVRPSPPSAALQKSLSVPSLSVINPQNISYRHTYGGLDTTRQPRRRDRSVPAYLGPHQQGHAAQPVIIRTPTSSFVSPVVTDRTYPLRAPPSKIIFPVPATDADVTYLTKPSEIKPGRPFEPLSQSIVQRIPSSPVLETDMRTQPVVDHLKRKLAQAEADKFVEKMTLNELRAKLEEDTRRYENELQHAHELHNEMMKYKTLLAEMEVKNETLRKAIELEKRRFAYMEKMKNATTDMLAEREVGMKLVEEEKEKYNSLRDICQQLQAMVIETEKEIRNLENSVEYKKAIAKKRELDSYEARIVAEQKVAADLWREIEAEKNLNRELTQQLKIHEGITNDKRQALQVISDDKKRLQTVIEELMGKLDQLTYEKQMARKKLEMARRKHADMTKDSLEPSAAPHPDNIRPIPVSPGIFLAQSPASFRPVAASTPYQQNTLEKENAKLKLQLKQADLQLQALVSDTPLKLKLKEANTALQKLVAEREQLQSHLTYLEEQKEILNRTLSNIKQENDDLKQQLKGGPNILVTDGHMEDVNAKYASERAAWLKEKEALQKALAQATRTHSLSDFDADLHHILKRYLRAESYRKSLAWQKQYLLTIIAGYKEEESNTVRKLKECVGPWCTVKEPLVRINKFKVAALAVVSISRMINIVEHRRGSRQSTYDILYKALSKSKKLPYKCHPKTETNLWEIPGGSPTARRPLLVPSTPGCVSEYMEHFNELQNRIRLTLASNNS